MSDSTQSVALVTGASRGIGECIAKTLAASGHRVIGTATSPGGADKISGNLGDRGRGVVLDVNEGDAITEVVADIAANEGPVSVLVNNAGVTRDGLLLRMKSSDWESIIDTNLSAVYRVSKACLKGMMKARFGRIINIGSVVAAMGNPGQANYAAAKAGMIGFSKSLAHEVGARGITVNVVAPGFIETDMTRALSEDQRAALVSQVPVARLGSVEDVAATVAFLASTSAGYITGETVHVNGGMYMA